MEIAILSFQPKDKALNFEEKRLMMAAKQLGHEAKIYRSFDCQLLFDENEKGVLYKGKKFPKIDVLIPRARVLSDADIRLSFLKQFEDMGVNVLNGYEATICAKNKIRTEQILHSKKIPVLKTVVIEGANELDKAIEILGGYPVILKRPFGSYGSGVIIAESRMSAKSFMDSITPNSWKSILMIQKFVDESKGKDIRIFVVGEKVVASMERSAKPGEFRSNIELGGEGKSVKISKHYEEIAVNSAKALGLDIAGVDIIETKDGPAVLEVNANPGFKKLEEVTGIDIASEIINFATNAS